jgi:urease beta subunit
VIPGEVVTSGPPIIVNDGRPVTALDVTNVGDRPIQVGSHFHFFEVNRALRFDRRAGYGLRLDIPAGTAVRFEPGEAKRVRLIPLGGSRVVRGLNRLVEGALDERREAALVRAAAGGFVDDA